MIEYDTILHEHGPLERRRRRRKMAKAVFGRFSAAVLGLLIIVGLPMFWLGLEPSQMFRYEDPRRGSIFGWGTTNLFFNFSRIIMIPSILLAVVFLVLLQRRLRRLRERRSILVLRHVATAIELRLPLPAFLRTAAAAEGRAIQWRLLETAERLENGAPLSVALNDGELDARAIGLLNAAQRTGNTDGMIARVIEAYRTDEHPLSRPRASLLGFSMTLLTATLVLFMVAIFVMPKYREILRDFQAPMPAVTELVMNFDSEVYAVPILVISGALLIIAMISLTQISYELFSSQFYRGSFVRVFDGFTWRLPLFGGLRRNRDYADVSLLLADGLAAGHGLPDAVDAANQPHLNRVLRRRLHDFNYAVACGEDSGSAARRSRLPPLMSTLLRGSAGHDLADGLRFSAGIYAARGERVAVTLRAVAPVVTTFIMAAFVLAIALALFLPMVALVDAASRVKVPL